MRPLGFWCSIAVLSLFSSPAQADEPPAKRPNFVIILADDYGYADSGFQGCKDIPTPSIDSIAAGGVVCTNGYVSGPYCSPTRAACSRAATSSGSGTSTTPAAVPSLGWR